MADINKFTLNLCKYINNHLHYFNIYSRVNFLVLPALDDGETLQRALLSPDYSR